MFLSVEVVDSGEFKGGSAIDALEQRATDMLEKYVSAAYAPRVLATYRMVVGTEIVDQAVALCEQVASEFARTPFVPGEVILRRERRLREA